MATDPTVTACVLIIGNEVLSGRTADANLAYLAIGLNRLGIRLMEARVIRDDEAAIVDAVNTCRRAFDYVVTTGGIGPTHDDITAASVARAFGLRLRRDPEALKQLQRHYQSDQLNAARLKMADLPEGAALILNPVSGAPGFQVENVFVLAGVPSIMRAMFDGMRDRLRGGRPVLSRTIASFTTEGAIAERLATLQADHPGVEIGSYPFIRGGRFGVSLVLRSEEAVALDTAASAVFGLIDSLGLEAIEDADEAVG